MLMEIILVGSVWFKMRHFMGKGKKKTINLYYMLVAVFFHELFLIPTASSQCLDSESSGPF